MRRVIKGTGAALAALCALSFAGCGGGEQADIKLTVWVSEADQAFAKEVAEQFKKANPNKHYQFVFDVQGENEMATRVLGDVENAADIYSYPNDQQTQLVNGDALARIGGERLTRMKAELSGDAVEAATIIRGGVEEVYGIPYTDNTFFLYYDRSVLSETDVQSIDGILSKCDATKKFAFLAADGWYNTAFYFGKGLGYQVTYDENLGETSITCDFGNETGKAVTQSLWELVKNPKVKADADDSKIVAGIADGSIIAAFSGIWNRGAIEAALGDNFAAAKLPTYTYGTGADQQQVQLVSFAGYKLLGVNNYSAHKADAFAFADYYTNQSNQVRHFELRSYLPTNIEAQKDERVKNDACGRAIAQQLAYTKTQKNVPSTLWDPLKGLGNAMLTSVQTGNFELEEQLAACVKAIEKKS